MTDEVTAAVKLLAVEQELEFADEQDYQIAIALGVAAYRAARGDIDLSAERMWYFPIDTKVDAVFGDGKHRYWSTHCRHGRHDACKATELAPGVPRQPSQCKTCSAPCLCHCHLRDGVQN